MSANNDNSTEEPSLSKSAEFRIVVFDVPDDLESLELAMMQLPEMDRATARFQSHMLPGIITYSYDENTAIAFVNSIGGLGVKAAVVPACEVPDLMHAHSTHHIRLTADFLEAMDSSDKMQSYDLSKISVISVGILPSTAPSRFRSPSALASGSTHRTWNEGIKIPAKRRPEAFVVLSDGQSALNMASDELNYECLGERLATTSSANFKLLMQDLVNAATEAWVTPSTLAFLEHTPVPQSEFRSHEDFRRYTEFQTLLGRRHAQQPQSE